MHLKIGAKIFVGTFLILYLHMLFLKHISISCFSVWLATASFLTIAPPAVCAQEPPPSFTRKVFNKFAGTQQDSTRGASLIVIPALGYSQESGLEYGLAGTYNFYTDKHNSTSKTSNITLIGTLTTKKQKNIKLLTDIWTKDNDLHILSELRYRDWPFNFYGLGMGTLSEEEDRIGQKLVRLKVDVEKKITPKVYFGVNINYEHLRFQNEEPGGIFDQLPLVGKTGGQFLAFGLSALYDTRNTTTYTTEGLYGRAKYAYAPNFWKGDNFNGSLMELDSRYFFPISPQLTSATQAIFRSTWGPTVPFYTYRELGGDMMMRGYYLGRYIDKNYAAAQTELRYRLHPRIGLTAFGSAGSTFSKEHKARLVPSYGGGIRYFFSLEHNSTIRFDYAIGEKRSNDNRQSGFYISISEAF